MAEYIDREKLINDGIAKGFCDWYDEIKRAQKADVVERSEYKKLKQQLDEEHEMSVKVANNLLDVLGKLDLQKKENAELRSKIDKVIEEMERYSTAFEYANKHDLASAVDYCIWVIQENIGE